MSRGLHPAAVARTTAEARRGRSLAERLAMRIPGLLGHLVAALLRLPRARLRTRLLEYMYRRAYAAWNRRDWELNTILHDDARYELIWPREEVIPGARSSYSGVEGYLEFAETWLEAFGDLRFRLLGFHDRGGTTIVTHIRQRGHGTGSGVAVEDSIVSVDEFDRGRLIKQTEWRDTEAGLRAQGLTPPDGVR